MLSRSALAEPAHAPPPKLDRRAAVRQTCALEALSRPLETADTICWGATIQDVSAGGVGLVICYPFKAGTFLTVDVRTEPTRTRTLLVRVVHVTDQADGTWFVGCEFASPLSAQEVAALR